MESLVDQLNQSWGNLVDKLEGWIDSIVTNLPNFILALLVIGLGIFLARYVRRNFYRGIRKLTSNETISSAMSNIGTAAFIALFVFIAIGILNLDTVLASLLGAAGVAGLAVGLALQEPLMNLFSGILLSIRKLYNLGDLVETNGYFGRIDEITLRTTQIKTLDGKQVTIPNKLVIQNPMVNYTNTPERRMELECGISYGEDLGKVKEVALAATKDHCPYDENFPVEFFYTGFGDSSINFTLRFWLKNSAQKTYLEGKSEAIMALKKAFDENDIMIPFPIRTLDFGIKGGEKLNEMIHFDHAENGNGNQDGKQNPKA